MMNAFRPRVISALKGKRFFSSVENASARRLVEISQKRKTFKEGFFGDPATYPLIVILGCAVAFATGVGTCCLAYNPDVKLDKKKRSEIMRD
mmetsp:Transcript_36769/g.54018  ORF Transcript_36769/g.54018 Transcript_36769/m.54018 type:complete len:92 (+) Transcript_36769:88-363(+)